MCGPPVGHCSYTRRLERVHSRFVSSVTSSNSDLKLPLTERQTFHTAVKVFKILHEVAPPYLTRHVSVCLSSFWEESPTTVCFKYSNNKIMDEDLCGFVIPLDGTTCPLL